MKKFKLYILPLALLLCTLLCSCELLDVTDSGELYAVQSTAESPSSTKPQKKETRDSDTEDTGGEHIHTPELLQGKKPSCTEVGVSDGEICGDCGEILKKQVELPANGHSRASLKATPATCTSTGLGEGEHCSECGLIFIEQPILPKLPHTPRSTQKIAPTWDSEGFGSASECAVCHEVLSADFTYPALKTVNSSYGYTYLGTMHNGSALQTLYNQLDTAAVAFHNGGAASDGNTVVTSVDYSSLGLDLDSALAVWSSYKADRPLYYWISTSVTYTQRSINLLCAEEYKSAETRLQLNQMIYSSVVDMYSTEDSAYSIVLLLHDSIIGGMDYAYETDGVTPQDDIWAHNILGYFQKQSGVCEAYSRTFQLLLNYCGIENLFVTGDAGGAHAWNLVKMDDGAWYWFDLTWDDTPEYMLGMIHKYFCVSELDVIDSGKTFTSTHSPDLPTGTGLYFLYALPARSQSTFKSQSIPSVGDTFTADGARYTIIGHDSVELNYIEGVGRVTIPQTVEYMGRTFTVRSVGFTDEQNFLKNVTASTVTSVVIPQTVCFILDNAFGSPYLEEITVDAQNAYFTSLDGVLFTKSLYTLIQYPSAKAGSVYTAPAETRELAYGAFYGYLKLEILNIGANTVLGRASFGYGYNDAAPAYPDRNIQSGELDRIRDSLSGSKTVNIA